jgi:hypothetical protein
VELAIGGYAFKEWCSVKAQGQLHFYLDLYLYAQIRKIRIRKWIGAAELKLSTKY